MTTGGCTTLVVACFLAPGVGDTFFLLTSSCFHGGTGAAEISSSPGSSRRSRGSRRLEPGRAKELRLTRHRRRGGRRLPRGGRRSAGGRRRRGLDIGVGGGGGPGCGRRHAPRTLHAVPRRRLAVGRLGLRGGRRAAAGGDELRAGELLTLAELSDDRLHRRIAAVRHRPQSIRPPCEFYQAAKRTHYRLPDGVVWLLCDSATIQQLIQPIRRVRLYSTGNPNVLSGAI